MVVSMVFENKTDAINIAREVEEWSDKFTRLTIIERPNDEFTICCYQDPQISKREINTGLLRTGMKRSVGYEQAKPMIKERPPLVQITYASDAIDMSTYEQISRLVPIRKCRIISEKDLKRQEFYYEKTAKANSE